MREKLLGIVIDALEDLNEEIGSSELDNPVEDTRLFGDKSPLDSLSLINLVIDVEERIFDLYAKEVTLTDEKAMSLRNSPFRRVSTLVDYLEICLEENE